MKGNIPGKIKQSVKLKTKLRLVIAAGISVLAITMMLVIYFQFFKNEQVKANQSVKLQQDSLPTDLKVEEVFLSPSDTNMRNGVRYKVARPLKNSINE